MYKYLFSFVAVFVMVASAAEARFTHRIDTDRTVNYGYMGDQLSEVNCPGSNEHFDAYMTDHEINFDFDSSRIKRGERGRHTVRGISLGNAHYNKVSLDRIADYMKKYPHTDAHLEAFTDIRGSHDYNDVLAMKRAKSTKKALVKRGVDANRLHMVPVGEHVVNYPNHAPNRAVHVTLQD